MCCTRLSINLYHYNHIRPVSYDSIFPCLNLKLACSVLVMLATRTRMKTAVMMCVGSSLASVVVVNIVRGGALVITVGSDADVI